MLSEFHDEMLPDGHPSCDSDFNPTCIKCGRRYASRDENYSLNWMCQECSVIDLRTVSSFGRALGLHPRGGGIKALTVHQVSTR